MANREPISKRVRFEVFKRDMFTCQYCGQKAPDVVLHVDHINPVAKGGKNEITNLITCCFDCNSGKSDKKLSDNSVVVKQQKQLELIQERKEQLEMVFKWKKSLDRIDEKTLDQIIKQIELRMKPNTVNEKGRQSVRALVKKFSVEKILNSIDVSANKYIKFTQKGEITDESAEDYFNKISGILYTETLSPLKKKIVYLKGIVRNRFGKDDSIAISIKINDYVKALKGQNYTDENIIDDFDKELIPKTLELSWWSEWRNMIDKWIEDINNWDKKKVSNNDDNTAIESKDYDDKTLTSFAQFSFGEVETSIKMILYLGKQFPDFNEDSYKTNISSKIMEFVTAVLSIKPEEFNNYKKDKTLRNHFIGDYIGSNNELFTPFSLDGESDNYFILEKSFYMIDHLLTEIFEELFPANYDLPYENIVTMLKRTIGEIKNYQESEL